MNPEKQFAEANKDILLIKKLIQRLADHGGDPMLTCEAIGRITAEYKNMADISGV